MPFSYGKRGSRTAIKKWPKTRRFSLTRIVYHPPPHLEAETPNIEKQQNLKRGSRESLKEVGFPMFPTTAGHFPLEQFMHREIFGVGEENAPSCHSVMPGIPQLLPSAEKWLMSWDKRQENHENSKNISTAVVEHINLSLEWWENCWVASH